MFLADSMGAWRRAGAAIATALDAYFPKCEKLSLTSYAERGEKKPRHSFSDLFFLRSFKFLCIVFTALALTSTTLAGQAPRPTAAAAQADSLHAGGPHTSAAVSTRKQG